MFIPADGIFPYIPDYPTSFRSFDDLSTGKLVSISTTHAQCPVLDRFTQDVARVMERATEEARSLGHAQVQLEHLLLAFAFDSECYPARMLRMKGFTYPILWREVESVLGRGEMNEPERPISPELKQFLYEVVTIARWPVTQGIPSKIVFDYLLECSAEVNHLLKSTKKPAFSAMGRLLDQIDADSTKFGHGLNEKIPMACGDLTEAANFALLFARIDAATFNFDQRLINSESILVGLIAEQGGEAGKRLRKMGLTIRNVRGDKFAEKAHSIKRGDLDSYKFTVGARKILRVARKICGSQQRTHVTSNHLLWAILISGQSKARDLFAASLLDLAALRLVVKRNNPRTTSEGSLNEMDLDFCLLSAFDVGNQWKNEHARGTRELWGEDCVPVPESSTFDLSQLDPLAIDSMLAAYREYLKSPFVNFDCKHVFLGLLAQGLPEIEHTLLIWGVRLNGARVIVNELESLGPVRVQGKKLPDDVAVLLNQALALAQLRGFEKVRPEHMLLALVKSVDPQIMVLMFRLGLDPVILVDHVACLCQGKFQTAAGVYEEATPGPRAVSIFGTLCRVEVDTVIQIAVDEARACGKKDFGGDHLLLGLLRAPGKASEALKALGLTSDTMRSAIHEKIFVDYNKFQGELFPLRNLLLQSPGPWMLPMRILSPHTFMAFMRRVEHLTINEKLAPIIVYWSCQNVSRLLPPGRDFGRLVATSSITSFFAEFRKEPSDPWCFLVRSTQLSLVLYGQLAYQPYSSEQYLLC